MTKEFLSLPGVIGVGTDLLREERIAGALERHGERFARRVLTAEEFTVFSSHRTPLNYLAKAFAAKEALAKALGTGIAQGVSFQDFSIVRDGAGKPVVKTSGVAQEHLVRRQARLLISLTDEGDFIQAFAILASCS